MEDYLKTGAVNKDLSVLYEAPKTKRAAKDDLFLQGYGRQWGEKLTYSVGLSYGTGILLGGTYGLLMGLRKGGATPKLRLNAILNSCTTSGPALGNQAAAITMFYCGFSNLMQFASGRDEVGISAAAGGLSGGLYKLRHGFRPMATHAAVASGLFAAVDVGFRYGYL